MLVKGKIIDVSNNEPLAGASLTVIDRTGKILGGVTANSEGLFVIENTALDYAGTKVIVSNVGYGSQTLYPRELNGIIPLAVDGNLLDEVIVSFKLTKNSLVKNIVVIIVILIMYTIVKKLLKF